MNKPELSRRRFLAQVALAVPAGAVLLDAVVTNQASAQAAAPAAPAKLPRLEESDPSAKALGYVDNIAKVDRKSPQAARFAPGQECDKCSQLQGKVGDAYRPCAIFPGKLVAAKGWCSVWVKMA